MYSSLLIPGKNYVKEIIDEVQLDNSKYYASDIINYLNLSNEAFKEALFKAEKACIALNIAITTNFRPEFIVTDEGIKMDIKLSPVAAYFISINSDPSNPKVARLQYYFGSKYNLFNM